MSRESTVMTFAMNDCQKALSCSHFLIPVLSLILTGSLAIAGRPRKTDELDAKAKEGRTRIAAVVSADDDTARHAVSKEHPRLLGSRERLQRLARERADAYQRVVRVARQGKADVHSKMISLALVSAIERDRALGRQAIDMALKIADGPIKKGHVQFGNDLAWCGIAYDLCHEYWTPEERARFHQYMNKTVDANIRSESHVFHNGWYGYKNWGIGLACYATYYENPRAEAILRSLESDYRTRAAPALELAGAGGGWGEGYYGNYWLYEWLFFCEVARWCEGVDYYAMAPAFFRNRAVASMFETYPGIGIYNTRRPIPMGDGGGRVFGGDRDKALSARRILVNHFRDDPSHQVVHALNETTRRSGAGNYAYKDFLWRDTTVRSADLSRFRLSHISPGPGYVHARSSWDEDAVYFFFKCGDRFTAHQHLDVGHFLIYKHEELAGDGGHYDDFGSPHDVNYHLRSIAHNTILVHDPSETWPNIRAGRVTGNDGGQAHNWPHHNGAVTDAAAWNKDRRLYDIADIAAFEDCGSYVYVAGDCSRAYSPKKLDSFTRQIVFGRPGTFVVFDRVVSREPEFKKTWLLQAMKRPEKSPAGFVITNGKGRLFVQTLLPRDPQVKLYDGQDLYSYDGNTYPPRRDTGPAPECRIEISPPEPAREDYFLHVLTATDSTVESVPMPVLEETDSEVRIRVGKTTISFDKSKVAGSIEIAGHRQPFPGGIVAREDSGSKKMRTP
ncbi:MAG: heparinase II/III family protein [Planctomycetes bacterium]|nr:heparinase II/III family protein [Planctomycetota bacterium]MBL7043881.1 heparinase II/III family protein [Pirellulaceae bacterium]